MKQAGSSLPVAFHPCLARRGSTHRDAGKDLIVRIVKSRAGDISPGKNLILVLPQHQFSNKGVTVCSGKISIVREQKAFSGSFFHSLSFDAVSR